MHKKNVFMQGNNVIMHKDNVFMHIGKKNDVKIQCKTGFLTPEPNVLRDRLVGKEVGEMAMIAPQVFFMMRILSFSMDVASIRMV